MDAGAKKRVIKKKVSKYVKTTKTYRDKCGNVRVVYEKNGNTYIKKKSKKTGKFGYAKVKA